MLGNPKVACLSMALTGAVAVDVLGAPGDHQVSVTLLAHKLITDVTIAELTTAAVESY